jgi:mycothiol synthase
VIHHEWFTELTGEIRDELGRLLSEAARADAEAGFPSLALGDEVPEGTRYLLIWLLPDERSGRDEPPPTLAGCLRLETSGPGRAEARLVIHPELRSRGISTALCEQVGLEVGADDGWEGTGYSRLSCWARGDHPAAQRISLRFSHTGLRRARREWRLLALLRTTSVDAAATTDPATTSAGSAEVCEAAPGTPGLDALWRDSGRSGSAPKDGRVLVAGSGDAPAGAAWFDGGAAEPTEFGPAGLLRAVVGVSASAGSAQAESAQAESAQAESEAADGLADSEAADGGMVASLLGAAMAAMRESGARVAVITVADHEEELLTACRHAGFQHDQTDCEYVLE